MQLSEAYHWLEQGLRRQQILLQLKQPMTANQLSKHIDMSRDRCSDVLWELRIYELVECLNPKSRQSRLYWLTELGKECQHKLLQERGLPVSILDFPEVDWELYGWVCFSHRSAVIKELVQARQPFQIAWRAVRFQDPTLRMSSNNVRDIIKLFLEREIVELVWDHKNVHPKYRLTETGEKFMDLLRRAETNLLETNSLQ